MKRLFALAAALLTLGAWAADPSDLLPPDQAFKPSATKKDDHTLVVHVDVADGYYLYRDRMQFSLQPGDGKLTPSFPEGKVKHDEYFGEMVTYRHSVDVPLKSEAVIGPDTKLKLVSQGCADAGVCYPPQTVQLTLGGSKVSARLDALFGSAPQAAPVAEKAPAETAKAKERDTAKVVDHDAAKQTAAAASHPAVAQPASAEAHKAATVHESAASPEPAKTGVAPIAPPPVAAAATTTAPDAPAPLEPVAPAATQTGDADDTGALFRSGNLGALLGFFFIAGLGLAFTACMYPLIPIVSGIVVGQGHATTKTRGFALSFVYVQGMALTYALAGVAAALSGTLLSNALQNPWVLSGFALFFVVMALSMFDLFELQLPNAFQSKLNDASNRLIGGRWVPVFLMGALSALIVGPCVAPPLAAALGYIGASGNVLRGGLALYAMALGMGLPLIVVGVLGGHALPKAGPWMNQVRNTFGTVMLAVALWIARPALPDWAFMLGWALLALGAAVALSALDPLASHAGRMRRVSKAAGVALLLVGAAELLGLLMGGRDPLQPLKPLAGGRAVAAEAALPFQPVTSPAALDAALAAAHGKPVMLDFYADWCVSCKEMERETFSDAKVHQALGRFVLLKADVTANTDEQKALLKRFGLFGPPGTIFYDPNGKEAGPRLIGFEDAERFVRRLGKLHR